MLRIITLIFALSLILTVAIPLVDAHVDTPLARRHAPAVNRMLKKRALTLLSPIANSNNAAAAAPPAALVQGGSSASSSAASPTANPDTVAPAETQSSQLLPPTKASSTAASVITLTAAAAQSSSASQSGVLPTALSSLLGGGQSANTSTSTSSSASSTSASTSSTPLTSSSPSSTPTPTQLNTPTPSAQTPTSFDPVTITSSATPPASTAAATTSGSVTKLARNTIIILVAIGGSLVAAGIIWTIIRKWKFRPSSSFEDRMQPIDWQPTTAPHDDRDITEKLTRNGSTRSHGSFTSGNHHDNLTPDLPTHDFTAGPAHLAPIGGYADLQRGPSPQPDLQRGPSFHTQTDYQYDIPNPHGQYYNGAGVGAGPGAGVGLGAYQGGYDYNRGY